MINNTQTVANNSRVHRLQRDRYQRMLPNVRCLAARRIWIDRPTDRRVHEGMQETGGRFYNTMTQAIMSRTGMLYGQGNDRAELAPNG
jgi:hypothetical protein